jgi:Antitoxin FitA-like, ribbon-helix-helix
MQFAGMTTVLTIRNVPAGVKEALARGARERGQSLQAFSQRGCGDVYSAVAGFSAIWR